MLNDAFNIEKVVAHKLLSMENEKKISPDMARLYVAIKAKRPEINYKADLARLINESEQTVNNWEARGIPGKKLLLICNDFDLDAAWIATGEGEVSPGNKQKVEAQEVDDDSEYVGIKRVDLKISAGVSGFSIEFQNGDRSPIFFRKDWLERKGYIPAKLFALPVVGRSMEDKLFEDDMVVINSADQTPVDGEVFAINFEGEVVIKRLMRSMGKWWITSDNPHKAKYPNKVLDEHSFIIGRIIYKQSERI